MYKTSKSNIIKVIHHLARVIDNIKYARWEICAHDHKLVG